MQYESHVCIKAEGDRLIIQRGEYVPAGETLVYRETPEHTLENVSLEVKHGRDVGIKFAKEVPEQGFYIDIKEQGPCGTATIEIIENEIVTLSLKGEVTIYRGGLSVAPQDNTLPNGSVQVTIMSR